MCIRDRQEQLREYFASLVTPAYVTEMAESEGGGPEYTRVLRKLGADGWLGLGWPKQYGGQDRTPIDQFVFFDEAMRAGVDAGRARERGLVADHHPAQP